MDNTYNGWTNRETWAAHLWITNDQVTDWEARRVVHTMARTQAEDTLAEWLEDMLYGDNPIAEAQSWRKDIGSLWRINWREIVNAIREDEPIEDDEPDEPDTAIPAPFGSGDAITVDGYRGIAWRVIGGRDGRIVAYMVGDDREFTHDPDDCHKIDDDAFCPSCGQTGCDHYRSE